MWIVVFVLIIALVVSGALACYLPPVDDLRPRASNPRPAYISVTKPPPGPAPPRAPRSHCCCCKDHS